MSLAPFLPSPINVINKMLEAAELKPGETLYDMGSGDGRIIILAAEKYDAYSVGIELDNGLVNETRRKIQDKRLEDKVKVIHANFMDVDISSADVVTLYLLTSTNKTLRPNLERYLKPGARIVSHDFEIPDWKPVQIIDVIADYGAFDSTIYLYKKT